MRNRTAPNVGGTRCLLLALTIILFSRGAAIGTLWKAPRRCILSPAAAGRTAMEVCVYMVRSIVYVVVGSHVCMYICVV